MEQRIESLALVHASHWWRRIVAVSGLAYACATFALPDSSSGSPQTTAHNEHPQSGRAGAVVLDSAITILESADAPEALERAAQDLATDFEKVLGKKPRVVTREQDTGPTTIFIAERSKVPDSLRHSSANDTELFSISIFVVDLI